MKHFYSHLIEIDSIYIELDLIDMTPKERAELVKVLEANIHYVVLDTVMSELPGEHKKTFLSHVAADQHDEIWELLNKNTRNINKKIIKSIDIFKKQLKKDLQRTKK